MELKELGKGAAAVWPLFWIGRKLWPMTNASEGVPGDTLARPTKKINITGWKSRQEINWGNSSRKMKTTTAVKWVLLLATLANAELTSRVVRTKYGELSGIILTLGRNLESVEVFRGIPYASPPIGSLRFMPPVSGALWHGIKKADRFGPVCPQRFPQLNDKMPIGRMNFLKRLLPYLQNQSEDCLYLNIYAPVQGNFQVFVWIFLNSSWSNLRQKVFTSLKL